MNIKIKYKGNKPTKGTLGSAGYDVMALETYMLYPGEMYTFSTGLFVEIPSGWELTARPRSGLAFKYGITLINSPGTIDEDYRGEIKVALVNHGNTPIYIHEGDRICQLLAKKVYEIDWEEVEEFEETERGTNGFGHTGR